MSDPVTNVEIEDVLSSIRRLVSEDVRPRPAPRQRPEAVVQAPQAPSAERAGGPPDTDAEPEPEIDASSDRLVLTPAQRVPEAEDAPTSGPILLTPADSVHLPEPGAPRAVGAADHVQADEDAQVSGSPFDAAEVSSPLMLDASKAVENAATRQDDGDTSLPNGGDDRSEQSVIPHRRAFDAAHHDPDAAVQSLLGKLVEEELSRAMLSGDAPASRRSMASVPPEPQQHPKPEPQSAADTSDAFATKAVAEPSTVTVDALEVDDPANLWPDAMAEPQVDPSVTDAEPAPFTLTEPAAGSSSSPEPDHELDHALLAGAVRQLSGQGEQSEEHATTPAEELAAGADEPTEGAGDGGLAHKIAAIEEMISRRGDTSSRPARRVADAPFVHRPAPPLDWDDYMPSTPAAAMPEGAADPAPAATPEDQAEEVAHAPLSGDFAEDAYDELYDDAMILQGPVWQGSQAGFSAAPVPETTARALADAPVRGGDLASLLDEDALRDIVSEVIRQELQGALGERITRNVRKLVRREIHRMLMTREYE
ncbi:hypothetical protein GCM10011415_09500 [Salipiger pallidus]|uniref:Uncharacterized protein n=1 Tax=Salipiger pallidus TaxID=1775170 RepID=A0A8J2ZHT7_9RHOB|nr:hypothetical protein [Salipiger pallidus]GGG64889.1 hypothetical protein GCM10011415_09500 [Salipiger pallidus]